MESAVAFFLAEFYKISYTLIMEFSLPLASPLLIAGLAGGMLRAVVGYIKAKNALKKSPNFSPLYLLSTVFASGAIGYLTVWFFYDLREIVLGSLPFTPAISAVLGYAGGDIMENVYKIFTKRLTLFEKAK